uniref:Pyrin domain-containing protein n=1 Tax=Oreochromis niloticus TaxID=8128 RepID=A0A669EJ75_ORENI
MATTIKSALADTLGNLSKEEFERFCHQLLDRREGPRVRRSQVEDKSRLQFTDVLVSTFTEEGALAAVLEILKAIGCNQTAKELGKINDCDSASINSTCPSTSSRLILLVSGEMFVCKDTNQYCVPVTLSHRHTGG